MGEVTLVGSMDDESAFSDVVKKETGKSLEEFIEASEHIGNAYGISYVLDGFRVYWHGMGSYSLLKDSAQ